MRLQIVGQTKPISVPQEKKKKASFWFERPLLQTDNSKSSVLIGFIPLNFLLLPFPLVSPMDRGV